MSFRTDGIHHVTAIASDPQRNLDFYAGILGLRLVKRTVNFDDPTTYHFYFGDEAGSPGSILTFFPWPDARRGRQGGGQVAVTSFSILPSTVGFWIERLIIKRVEF
jgi:glyoxalase family protein